MKWYFASNSLSEEFFPLIKAAVLSAKKNTTLEPHFIYDGVANEFTQWLEEHGVKIIYHKCSFYDSLANFYGKDDLKIPTGAYLRCDIPMVEKDDDIVLYTDCDVLFLKDIVLDDIPQFKYFSCSSQFKKNDFVDFNTGVMFMKPKELAKTHEAFVNFIKKNISKMPVFDQSAYQIFYRGKNTPLPIKFNHKPYWGKDDSAIILHFHGPKPIFFTEEKEVSSLFYSLFSKNIEAYDYYLKLFSQYYPEIKYSETFIENLKNKKIKIFYQQRPFLLRLNTFIRKKYDKIFDFLKKLNIS